MRKKWADTEYGQLWTYYRFSAARCRAPFGFSSPLPCLCSALWGTAPLNLFKCFSHRVLCSLGIPGAFHSVFKGALMWGRRSGLNAGQVKRHQSFTPNRNMPLGMHLPGWHKQLLFSFFFASSSVFVKQNRDRQRNRSVTDSAYVFSTVFPNP